LSAHPQGGRQWRSAALTADVDRAASRNAAWSHAYSIASAPFETEQRQYLEFYVILERYPDGSPGRLTESMFRMDPATDNQLTYFDTIKGEFTLERRAAGFDSVVLVATGTGLAPFASMIKQLHFEAGQGRRDHTRYTLLHANRTYAELDYRAELAVIEAEQRFDFVYLPSVSWPTSEDAANSAIGKGRANNVLRHLFGMPTKEEQDVDEAVSRGLDATKLRTDRRAHGDARAARAMSLQDLQRRVAARHRPWSSPAATSRWPTSSTSPRRISRLRKEDW
jgi:ferredoxin-NADP reductase